MEDFDFQQKERIAMLRQFFKRREELVSELRAIDANINVFGKSYWKHLGYTVMPRIEKLRLAILGDNK